MFTVIDGVLLKPLPYSQPDKLLSLQEQTDWSNQFGNLWVFTYPNYLDCKRENHSLEMAAWSRGGGTVNEPGPAEYVEGRQISAELFPVLGVKLFRGRASFLKRIGRALLRWPLLVMPCGSAASLESRTQSVPSWFITENPTSLPGLRR